MGCLTSKPRERRLPCIKQQWNWENDIIVTPLQDLIKVDLPPPQKFRYLGNHDILRGHIYLYQRKTDQNILVEDITNNKFDAGGYSLSFRPSINVKKQEYAYVLAIEIKYTNDIIKVKRGNIIIHGFIGPHTQLKFKKNSSNRIQKQLDKKIDQIKQNNYILNIFILGRVGLGKSSLISNYMKMINQLYGFQYGSLAKTADSNFTYTKQFRIHPLKYTNKQNKSECQINLIDGPGLGGQLNDLQPADFSNIYCDALKLLLNGQLNYKEFNISKQIKVQAAKQNPNKIIHYCLIFIKPQEVKELFQIITKISTIITQSQITYGLVINKSDEYLGENVPSFQSIKVIKDKVLKEGYKVQGENHIFSTCLNQIYFPQNEVFYEQFQRLIYFSLAYAIQQVQNNIVNIYFQQNNTQEFIQMIQINNTKTIQQFVKETKQFFQNINDIQVMQKQQNKYRNLVAIINEENPKDKQSKTLLYYRVKVNNRYKIVFRFRPKLTQQ